MDAIQKKKGVPNSTSRKEEKLNKKKTNRARRQDGRKEVGSLDSGKIHYCDKCGFGVASCQHDLDFLI